ncbi:MAG: DUF5050 domain-containing protein [Oscillospiraceae bacterium]|nr:DUF5050 domain-containing protein [Oscillospiraceae bacterium]
MKQKYAENIIDAIGKVDDDLIREAQAVRSGIRIKKSKSLWTWQPLIALSACLVLVIGIGFMLLNIDRITDPEDRFIMGNTPGNTANGGSLAESDGWVYYEMHRKLYKMRTDGSELQILYDDLNPSYINVVDDWLYCVGFQNSNYAIIKMRTDGTESETFNYGGTIDQMSVVGDWIYFSDGAAMEIVQNYGAMYKVRTDFTDFTEIYEVRHFNMLVYEDWVYYINLADAETTHSRNIYRVNTEGEEVQLLNTDKAARFIISGDYIYYVNMDDYNTLYRINLDGSGREKLDLDYSSHYFLTHSALDFNVSGNWIYYYYRGDIVINYDYDPENAEGYETPYYHTENENTGFWRYNINTGEKEKLIERESPGFYSVNVGGGLVRYNAGWQIYDPVLTRYSGIDNSAPYAIGIGNTAGNLLNGGFAAYEDGYVYFNDSGLYRIRENNTEKTLLSPRNAENINVLNGYIYFTEFEHNPRQSTIYRIRTDGTDEVILRQDRRGNVSSMTVVDDWIYFARIALVPMEDDDFEHDGENNILRMRTDGMVTQWLNNMRSQYMNVVGGWIYYIGYADFVDDVYIGENQIYKMRLDGRDNQYLFRNERTEGATYDSISDLLVDGEWAYFTQGVNYDKLYKIHINGTDKSLIRETDDFLYIDPVNISGDLIYFFEGVYVSGEGKLYSMDIHGTESTIKEIIPNVSSINIINNYIYYYDSYMYNADVLCRMELDGIMSARLGEVKENPQFDMKALELLNCIIDEDGYILVPYDDWAFDPTQWHWHSDVPRDEIRQYFYGIWSGLNRYNGNYLIIDDSQKCNIQQSFSFYGYFRVSENVLVAIGAGNTGEIHLYWLDTNEPETMYYDSFLGAVPEAVFRSSSSSQSFRKLTKTENSLNEPQNGFMSWLALEELAERHDIPVDLVTSVEDVNTYTYWTDKLYPFYLVSEEPDKIVLRVELFTMAGESPVVISTIEKVDGEWVREAVELEATNEYGDS